MPIVAKKEASFIPAPEGQFRSVCCDVVDLGIIETTFNKETKKKHMIRVTFQIEEEQEETGKPYIVSQRFTLSMHEKANLRKFLESWRGKSYTETEAAVGIDVELMIGQNAVIQVAHNVRNGETYANIQSIMRPMKGMEKLVVRDYVRVKDRDPDQSQPTAPDQQDDDDDSLPF
jgi:hypothetical protein